MEAAQKEGTRMGRPAAFYYEDYDTKSEPEYLYRKEDADREFDRLEVKLGTAESLVRDLAQALEDTRMQIIGGRVGEVVLRTVCAALSRIPTQGP